MIASKVQIVYFHIDEKWFYSLVIRKFNKCVPEFGVEGVWNRIHHKNSIDKILCICAIAFIPINNDMRQGGTAEKITITRAGGNEKAQKNSYSREYKEDGTYHYPKKPENLLRKKGEEYFENWEITGSKEVSGTVKKFALTKWIKDSFFGDLQKFCQQLELKTGKRIHVRGQWDNASPHVELALLACIAELFGELGWVWTTQPANSPLTNICDAAIFPALAKLVSSYQGILAGGRYLQTDVLWKLIQKAWDEYPKDKIARAFIHHAQVAAAIYDCEGGDEFVQERNGLSCGVRKVCKLFYGDGDDGDEENALDLTSLTPRDPNRKAQGVIVHEEFEGVVDLENDDVVDLENDAGKRLKYPVPDMAEYAIGDYLSYEELALIAGDVEDVDYENLPVEKQERWGQFYEAWCEKQDELNADLMEEV